MTSPIKEFTAPSDRTDRLPELIPRFFPHSPTQVEGTPHPLHYLLNSCLSVREGGVSGWFLGFGDWFASPKTATGAPPLPSGYWGLGPQVTLRRLRPQSHPGPKFTLPLPHTHTHTRTRTRPKPLRVAWVPASGGGGLTLCRVRWEGLGFRV